MDSDQQNTQHMEKSQHERIEALKAENSRLLKYIDELEFEFQSIKQSRFWKMTAPLRFISNKFKKLLLVLVLVKRRLTHGDGLRRLFANILFVYRNEGWLGLQCKFRSMVQHSSGQTNKTTRDYAYWMAHFDTLTTDVREVMERRIAVFASKPLISILMPTYNTNIQWLTDAIESVRAQVYPHWELCIADDASTDPQVQQLLTSYAEKDARIKIVLRQQNGHISAASNSALELVNGEWTALLDHDDLLAENALFWVVDAINKNPDARLIYSDEDKCDAEGQRFEPYFKCDWNQDLFYSHNLITHLGVYRTDLLKSIGGFREGLEGAQDYDLALRYIENISTDEIHHIPRILYHWRIHEESTAQSRDAKPYALVAGEKALNDHFERTGVAARGELLPSGMYRVHYDLPDTQPLVSLIIPTKNGLQLIRQCIDSILEKTTYKNYEILVVDNGSDDAATLAYFDEIKQQANIEVLRDDSPFNFSALNNKAVEQANGEIIGLINNDIEVISADWLSEMVSLALRPEIGAVGARLWYPDDTLQHGGVIIGVGGVAGHAHKHLPRTDPGYFGRAQLIQSLSAVTAACLLVRKASYLEVGGLNEKELKVAFNDVDFCLKLLKQGYRNVWTPYAELYHHESASRGMEDTHEKIARFSTEIDYMKENWEDIIQHDPAYSPNLTLVGEDFSYAFPPRVTIV